MANNRIQLTIAGMALLVSTPEDEVYVNKLAEMIERDMQNVLSNNSSASVANTAILCALDYLDRFHKANRTTANMRAQIKEYMTEAADAKRLYDEEKKHSDALTQELESLRVSIESRKSDDSRTVAAANSASVAAAQQAVAANSAKQTEQGRKELESLRRDYDTVAKQCQSLTDRIRALNDYITNQDDEITRLKALENDQHARIQSQTQQIERLEEAIKDKQSEVESLIAELKSLEKIISNDTRPTAQPAQASPAKQHPIDIDMMNAQQPRRSSFTPVEPERPAFSATPEPQQREPFSDIAFNSFADDFDDDDMSSGDMPDLDWTKDI